MVESNEMGFTHFIQNEEKDDQTCFSYSAAMGGLECGAHMINALINVRLKKMYFFLNIVTLGCGTQQPIFDESRSRWPYRLHVHAATQSRKRTGSFNWYSGSSYLFLGRTILRWSSSSYDLNVWIFVQDECQFVDEKLGRTRTQILYDCWEHVLCFWRFQLQETNYGYRSQVRNYPCQLQ